MSELKVISNNEAAGSCDHCQTEEERYLCCVDEVGETLKRVVRNFQLFERDQVKTLGFTMTQAYCLIELLEHEGMTMQDLSDRMKLNTSTMTRVVDKLVRDGYIERNRSSEDRRVVLVSLTESGLTSAQGVSNRIKDYYGEITRHLHQGQVEDVLTCVSQLMDAFEKANPNCC